MHASSSKLQGRQQALRPCRGTIGVLSARSRGVRAPRVLSRQDTAVLGGSPVERDDGAAPQAESKPWEPLTNMWARNARQHGGLVAVEDPHHPGAPVHTFAELHQLILDFGAGLRSLGLQPEERVCLFSEDSSRWLVADQGIMAAGAADAVRGSTSPDAELHYILGHARPSGLVVQDGATLARMLPALTQEGAPALKFVAVLWPKDGDDLPAAAAAARCAVLPFGGVLGAGRALRGGAGFVPHVAGPQELATLVYTSGTTGHPKGVMLTHGNLKSQVDNFPYFLDVRPGEAALSLLPPWHIYQRTAALFIASRAAKEVYTSKFKFRDDLTARPPDHFVCVPLVLEMLHAKVMAKLKSETGVKGAIVSALMTASLAYVAANRVAQGVSLAFAREARPIAVGLWAALLAALLRPLHQLADALVFTKVRAALGIRKTIVSGGGSLPPHLDDFFEAAGITVIVGYGLTETAPVLACRRAAPASANIRGSVGLPIPGTALRVVDPATLQDVPDGEQGLVLARGPGVMRGYFDDPASTQAAFVDGGWFNTGDLGWRAPCGVEGSRAAGHLVLTGRAKDTIVLVSGKNVEPAPIEDALCTSPYIKHAIVVGQDKRELGALLFPDHEALAADGLFDADDLASALSGKGAGEAAKRLKSLLEREAARCLAAARPGARPEEHVAHVGVAAAPLSMDDGTLTRTMKPRRAEALRREAPAAAALAARLRG
ncbi:MAG: hypothetical protein J3K34DRAFT_2620 [Monoraphidium minutum]|nr:MAG: hypothetical protein J3K34DRAFT_2620 [Monoraphidium minutum]